jgi:hypothetical protein
MKIWRSESRTTNSTQKIIDFYVLKLVYKLMCVIRFDIQYIRNFLTKYTCKANWIGHILLRNCLLKHVIERKIEEMTEVSGRLGRRRKHLQDDIKENRILQMK